MLTGHLVPPALVPLLLQLYLPPSHPFSPIGLLSVPWMPYAPTHQRALANAMPSCRDVPSILPLSLNQLTPNHPSDLISHTISTGTHSSTVLIMENLHHILSKHHELLHGIYGNPNFIYINTMLCIKLIWCTILCKVLYIILSTYNIGFSHYTGFTAALSHSRFLKHVYWINKWVGRRKH